MGFTAKKSKAKVATKGRGIRTRAASSAADSGSVTSAWERLERALEKARLPANARLAAGATKARVDRFAADTQLSLPESAREYWMVHDGQALSDLGLGAGFTLLGLARAKRILKDWAEVRADLGGGLSQLDRSSSSHPPKAIQRKYSLPAWVPLLEDGEGNYIGLDLEPGPAGSVGQIINFGRDEDEKYVLFSGVTDLLNWLAREYENKRVKFDKSEEVLRHVDGRLVGVLTSRSKRSG